jgi:flagellar biogenesis protein FliO
MFRKIAILIVMILVSLSINADAGVKITSIDLQIRGANGYIDINLDGRYQELPDLKVNGNIIQVIISGADQFNPIRKKVSGAILSANTNNNKAVASIELPYDVKAQSVDVGWKNKNIQIVFPRGKAGNKGSLTNNIPEELRKVNIPVKEIEKKESSLSKENLNEDYLNKLVEEEKTRSIIRNNSIVKSDDVKTDDVKTQQSAFNKSIESQKLPVNKESGDSFSLAGYALKFFIFLSLVLGLFYGVVQLLKKGLFNKGKLGFLNNSQMIQVLSTTYVAPKRSLMIVRAHKQIFLVANSESGIQFLSEMSDTTGLIKEGEKVVSGTNFDINLETADSTTNESSFKIKENINESTPLPEEKGIQSLSAKDIVKFSDELKKKARKLKPIEFN